MLQEKSSYPNKHHESVQCTHICIVLLDLCKQIGQPVLPWQDAGVTVFVQVDVVLQQRLRQDIVGHHREVKSCAAPWWLGVGTAVRRCFPMSLKS